MTRNGYIRARWWRQWTCSIKHDSKPTRRGAGFDAPALTCPHATVAAGHQIAVHEQHPSLTLAAQMKDRDTKSTTVPVGQKRACAKVWCASSSKELTSTVGTPAEAVLQAGMPLRGTVVCSHDSSSSSKRLDSSIVLCESGWYSRQNRSRIQVAHHGGCVRERRYDAPGNCMSDSD